MSVSAIPKGFHSLTPFLIAKDATAAIEFYKSAFNAEVTLRLDMPDGGIAHAELKIGNSHFMLTGEYPDMGYVSPETLGGAGVNLCIYVDGVDSYFAQAIAAGAKELRPVEDQFYGDRSGTLKDPFGHVWTISTHIEDLTEQEIKQRMMDYFSAQGA